MILPAVAGVAYHCRRAMGGVRDGCAAAPRHAPLSLHRAFLSLHVASLAGGARMLQGREIPRNFS